MGGAGADRHLLRADLMPKSRTDVVRWLLFTDDELEELRVGLVTLDDGGSWTTEGDMLLDEIKEEIESLSRWSYD